MIRLLAATVTAVALSTTVALAQKTMPGDRVYDLHSERQGSCQPMNWHIVATAGGVLSGTIAWDDMKVVAGVAGTIRPLMNVERYGKPLGGNSQDRAFQMIATEDRGNRIANITGTIWHNGWLTATIQGPGMACRNIKVQWLQPAPR